MKNFSFEDAGIDWNLSRDTTFRLSWCLWNLNIARVNQEYNKWRDYADSLYDELEPLFVNIPPKYKHENWPEKLLETARKVDEHQRMFNMLQHEGEFNPMVKSNFIGLLREYTSLLRKVMHALDLYLQRRESVTSKIGKEFGMDFSEIEDEEIS